MHKIYLLSLICFSIPILATVNPDGPTAPPRGTITPIASKSPNGLGMFVDIDFTWWKSQISGMNFAEVNHNVISTTSSFRPGFKIGAGIDLDFDGWDTYAQYTWFSQPWATNSTESKKDTSYSSFVYFNPTSSSLSSLTPQTTTSSRKEQFNILDVELGRNFYISRKITLRPFFGVKLARMLEKTNIIQKNHTTSEKVKTFLSQSLSGIGGRAGIDSFWHITDHLGLYGDLALTALWSRIHNHYSSYFSSEDSSTHRFNTLHALPVLPVLEMGIGVAYETWFAKERYQLYATAGWEEQVWINYNYNTPNAIANNSGNLTLQGLTLKVGCAF